VKDDKLYLIHIIESINKIQSYLTGMDCAAFMKNRLRSWATILLPGQLRVKSIGKQRPLGAFGMTACCSSHIIHKFNELCQVRKLSQ